MKMTGPVKIGLLYGEKDLLPYFQYSQTTDAVKHLHYYTEMIDRVNSFGKRGITWEDLFYIEECKVPLQYYRDERFLSLYSFAALDYLGQPEKLNERRNLLDQLLQKALPGGWTRRFRNPKVYIDKPLVIPEVYEAQLKKSGEIEKHPNAYIRSIGTRLLTNPEAAVEGPTRADVLVSDDDNSIVLFCAKFLTDISYDTQFNIARNQISRSLDGGLMSIDMDLNKFYFVFICPRRFKEKWHERFYGYKLNEYRKDVQSLRRDLPHFPRNFDFPTLSKRIGWIAWEDIYEILNEAGRFEGEGEKLKLFFEERCLVV